MNHFLENCKNCKSITLDAEPNVEAFYNKFGFKKISELETSIKDRFLPIMELIL